MHLLRRVLLPLTGRHLRGDRVAELPPAVLEQRLAEGGEIQILDIRRPEAYAAGHLPGAVNVPLADLLHSLGRLDRTVPTAVY